MKRYFGYERFSSISPLTAEWHIDGFCVVVLVVRSQVIVGLVPGDVLRLGCDGGADLGEGARGAPPHGHWGPGPLRRRGKGCLDEAPRLSPQRRDCYWCNC